MKEIRTSVCLTTTLGPWNVEDTCESGRLEDGFPVPPARDGLTSRLPHGGGGGQGREQVVVGGRGRSLLDRSRDWLGGSLDDVNGGVDRHVDLDSVAIHVGLMFRRRTGWVHFSRRGSYSKNPAKKVGMSTFYPHLAFFTCAVLLLSNKTLQILLFVNLTGGLDRLD